MRNARKRETYVRSQSFSTESAVKYLHVGRRKIQISLPPGEQDQSNALPQEQQRQSNPHPMPCLPPAGHYIDRCIIGYEFFKGLIHCLSAIYYSFKIFPPFLLAKSTRLIQHNQLLMTKFGRNLTLTRK